MERLRLLNSVVITSAVPLAELVEQAALVEPVELVALAAQQAAVVGATFVGSPRPALQEPVRHHCQKQERTC